MLNKEVVKVNGQEYPAYRTTNDVNGNPRYIIHYLAIGLKDYESNKATRAAGLRKYHGRAFGGGFVFQSYGLEHSIRFILEKLGGK